MTITILVLFKLLLFFQIDFCPRKCKDSSIAHFHEGSYGAKATTFWWYRICRVKCGFWKSSCHIHSFKSEMPLSTLLKERGVANNPMLGGPDRWKIIALPGGQNNDLSSRRISSLPFLPATNSSLSRTLQGVFEDMTSVKGPQAHLVCCFWNGRKTRTALVGAG